MRCANPVLNARNFDSIDAERMPIAAHVLARSCGQAFDEAVSFVVIMVRGRFKRRDVTSAYGYEHPAGRITRLSNVEADRH